MHPIGTKFKAPSGFVAKVTAQPRDPANLWDVYELEFEDGSATTASTRCLSKDWEKLPDQITIPSEIPGETRTYTARYEPAQEHPKPPKKTFYQAASSKDLAPVRVRASDLKARGYDWYGGLDWTLDVERDIPESFYLGAVHNDLAAAVHADLFVLILDTANVSFGAAAEYGARLNSGKIAHVVSAEKKHPFLFHANARWHPTWEAFLAKEAQ